MPEFTITAPDGTKFNVTAPEGATEEEALEKVKQQYSSQQEEVEEPSTLRQIEFGFDESSSDVENLGMIMESYMPLGRIALGGEGFIDYVSPEEAYGTEFMDASYDERREMLNKLREDGLKREYQDIYQAGLEDSTATTVGGFAGILASPTTLAPVGQSYKAAAGIGALLGAEMTALEQLRVEGELSPEKVLTSAALGGVLAPVGIAAGRAVTKGLNKRKVKKEVAKADAEVEKIETVMAEAVLQNVPVKELSNFVQKATGKTKEELVEVATTASRKPKVPTVEQAKIIKEAKETGFDAVSRGSNSTLDQFLGVVSTRVGMISEPLKQKLRKMDMDIHINTHEALKKVEPFAKAVQKLPKQSRVQMNKMLINGNYKGANLLLSRYTDDADTVLKGVTDLLDEQHNALVNAGYTDLTKIENYFPRMVKDKKGLFNAIGKPQQSLIQKAIADRKSKLGVDELSALEEDKIINNVLRGFSPKVGTGGLSQTQARTIQNVNDDLLQFYADPLESLEGYIRGNASNIARRKFFGQSAVHKGDDLIRVEDSVDSLIAREMKDLSPEDVDTLKGLLNARFINGEKGSSRSIQALRNIGYATTIANPVSAVVQLADLGVSAYVNGFKNTLAAMISPNKKLSVEDFGLLDKLAEEFANEKFMASTMHTLFKRSGFQAVDKLGKNTFIRAAFNKGKTMANSKKGLEKLRDKYGKALGKEFDVLVDDLKAGKVTDTTKQFLWSELADVQPISLSEMPQKYLEAPDGRVFYSLKSFMLKQIDLLRRDIPHQWKKGNKKEAMKNAIAYSLIVPTANMTVDQLRSMMLGRPPEIEDLEDVPGEYASNVLKLFGGSEYLLNRYIKRGNIGQAALSVIAPPLNLLDSFGESVIQATKGEAPTAILKDAPIFGRFWGNWFEGGLERHLENRQTEKEKEFYGN